MQKRGNYTSRSYPTLRVRRLPGNNSLGCIVAYVETGREQRSRRAIGTPTFQKMPLVKRLADSCDTKYGSDAGREFKGPLEESDGKGELGA